MTIHLSDHKLQGASLNRVPCCCALNSISTLTQASQGTAHNQLLSTAGILRQACSMGFLWWATLVQGLSTTLVNCPSIAQQPEALSLPNVLPSLLHWDQTGTIWSLPPYFKSPSLFSFIDVSHSKILAHLILSRCLFLKTPSLIYRGFGHHQIITSHQLLPRHFSQWTCYCGPSNLLSLSWFIPWFQCKGLQRGNLWPYVPSYPKKLKPFLGLADVNCNCMVHPYTKWGWPLWT